MADTTFGNLAAGDNVNPLLPAPASVAGLPYEAYIIRRSTLDDFAAAISTLTVQLDKMPAPMRAMVLNDPKVKALAAAYAALLAEMKCSS